MNKWWKDGVTEQELASRKQGVIGGYFVSLSTTEGLAETILANAQRGYDLGWLDGYPKAVKALTRDQVNAAIKAHINPSAMVLGRGRQRAGGRAAARIAGVPAARVRRSSR